MTTTTYIIAWAIYLSAAAVISAIFWKLSEPWRQDIKAIFRVSFLTMLFTPYFSDPQQYKFAPASLILFFELIFGDKNIALHAATPLAILLLIGIACSLIIQLMQQKKQ